MIKITMADSRNISHRNNKYHGKINITEILGILNESNVGNDLSDFIEIKIT